MAGFHDMSPRSCVTLALGVVLTACGDSTGTVSATETGTGSTTEVVGTTGVVPTTGDPPPTGTGPDTSGTGTDSGPLPVTTGDTTANILDTTGDTTQGPDTTTTGPDTTTDTTTGTTTGTTADTTAADTTAAAETTAADTTAADTTAASTTDASTSTTDASTSTTGTTNTTGDTDTDTGGEAFGLGYIGTSNSDRLVIFDPATALAQLPSTSLLPFGDYPYDATIKPDGSEVWIVGAVGDGVQVIDTATGQISHSIDLAGIGEYPVDVLFSADGTRGYVSSRDNGALVVIDAATYTVDGTIVLGGNYEGGKMALDPCSGAIYMVDWYDKSLFVIDPDAGTLQATLLGTSLWDLRYDPLTGLLYVLDRGPDVVLVVDAAVQQLVATVPVGLDPWGLDLTAGGDLLVVACEDDSSVHFVDTGTLATEVLALPAGADPRDAAVHPDDLRVYVPSGDLPAAEDGVFEIDLATRTITNTVLVGPENSNTNVVAVRPQPVLCP